MAERRKRSNGEASQAKILDAAAEIAGERGYEGTSIKLVSERSGLPASSIYWHFADKDELIAAVIDRSYTAWVTAINTVPDTPDDATTVDSFLEELRNAAEQLTRFPDFLRLGLMLILEHRPVQPSARIRFSEARAETLERIRALYELTFTGLGEDQVRELTILTLAGSDGLFNAAESEGNDLVSNFHVLANAILGAATAMGWSPSRSPARRP